MVVATQRRTRTHMADIGLVRTRPFPCGAGPPGLEPSCFRPWFLTTSLHLYKEDGVTRSNAHPALQGVDRQPRRTAPHTVEEVCSAPTVRVLVVWTPEVRCNYREHEAPALAE